MKNPAERAIRFIIALCGGDSNAPLPALRRTPYIEIHHLEDNVVGIIIGNKNGERPARINMVQLLGEVVAVHRPECEVEIEVETGASSFRMKIRATAGRIDKVLVGNIIMAAGHLVEDGHTIEASVLTVVAPHSLQHEEPGSR